MIKRSPSDLCLLCQTNPATKTNSHILSKFISTNFLGPKGAPRKGYEISSETALEKKPKTIQDSAKESHILCDECEEYFSVIEGLSSDTFANWQEKVTKGEFVQTTQADFLEVVECTTSDPAIIRIFVYSLFWRASVSNHGLFENFKLEASFEEKIRQILIEFKAVTRTDFINALKANPSHTVYPFSIITAKTFKDETSNFLLALPNADPYTLLVDRFSFILYSNALLLAEDPLKAFGNNKPTDCRMMIFGEDFWFKMMVEKPAELFAEQATSKEK